MVTHLECSTRGRAFDSEEKHQTCLCGAPLLVSYDLSKIADILTKDILRDRAPTLWRYKELLPVRRETNMVSLGEGFTPILPLKNLGHFHGLENLYLKDEGLLPTGTFKARGAAVGVSRAKELGIQVLAMPTNGNAGGA